MTGPEITPIGPPEGLEPRKPLKIPSFQGPEGERSFKQILEDSLNKVNQLQQDADETVMKYKNNEATPEELYISFQKAKIAFDALTEIRNKLLDAFEELQRMRI